MIGGRETGRWPGRAMSWGGVAGARWDVRRRVEKEMGGQGACRREGLREAGAG